MELRRGEMGHVPTNLLDNAFYAARAAQRERSGALASTVRGDGTGIPDEVQHTIFEPFFMTEPTGEGTGLGLSLSHDIVSSGTAER